MIERLGSLLKWPLLVLMVGGWIADRFFDQPWGLWVNGIGIVCFVALVLLRPDSKVDTRPERG